MYGGVCYVGNSCGWVHLTPPLTTSDPSSSVQPVLRDLCTPSEALHPVSGTPLSMHLRSLICYYVHNIVYSMHPYMPGWQHCLLTMNLGYTPASCLDRFPSTSTSLGQQLTAVQEELLRIAVASGRPCVSFPERSQKDNERSAPYRLNHNTP